jgi:hypothetical protein
MTSSHFSDTERTLQSRLAVVGVGKIIALDVGVREETISRWKNGDWPIPAFQAFAVSASQRNWQYLQTLAERWQAVLFPRRRSIAHWSTMQLLSVLMLSFGRFLHLAEKVHEGVEVLDDEEMRKLEEDGERMKQAIEAMIAKARQQREDAE